MAEEEHDIINLNPLFFGFHDVFDIRKKMNYWLYTEVLKVDDVRSPQFARSSTLNWMNALTFELIEQLGSRPIDQFNNLVEHFNSILNRPYTSLSTPDVFEPLYSCLTYALTLNTRSKIQTNETWTLPSSIVEWYYCWYNAIRSMIATLGQNVADKHASVYKYYASSLFRVMPNPLNMHAHHLRNEEYEIIAPAFPGQSTYDLINTFPDTRGAARGMLMQYLQGTAKNYLEQTKDDILKNSSFKDFRTKEARVVRDKRAEKYISFMHCAFRYRGKANYRDGIFLTYGQINSDDNLRFLRNLANNTKFAFLIAFALIHTTSLRQYTAKFINDVNNYLRGIESLEEDDKFWNVI